MQDQNSYQAEGGLQRRSIIAKTNYNKQRPDLRRHYPEEWGRFLDNHYDPAIH